MKYVLTDSNTPLSIPVSPGRSYVAKIKAVGAGDITLNDEDGDPVHTDLAGVIAGSIVKRTFEVVHDTIDAVAATADGTTAHEITIVPYSRQAAG